jgi:hypothetical protein
VSKPSSAPFDSQTATIADILAAVPAYAEQLRTYKLDVRDETIRRSREALYATMAYLLAIDADGKLARRRRRSRATKA